MGIVMTIVLMVVVAALTTATILTTESAMRDAKAAEEKMVVIVKNKIPMPEAEEKLEQMRLSVIEQLKQGNVIAHPSAFEVELKIIRADEGTEKLTDQIAEELKEKCSGRREHGRN